MFTRRGVCGILGGFLIAGLSMPVHGVSFDRLRALGDSLTICTQGGMVSDHRNQPRSWVALLATQMGTTMRLPLLEEMNAIGQQRRMDYPDYGTIDCYAYNGVSVDDTFQKQAVEIPWYQFGWNWNHLELILAGKTGYSMVQALVEDNPTFVVGFLGSNDFMERVMARGTMMEGIPTLGLMDEIDPLDATDLRPQELFFSDFQTVVSSIYKPGVGMCFGTIPMLPDIPGILNKQELTDFVGENSLPEDCFTNYTVAAAVYGGLKGPEIFADDRNYYTPEELQTINNAIIGYNNTIRTLAADPAHPFAVAETPIQMPEITHGTVRVNGWRINNRLFINNLGKPRASIMTTDGVHMTDIGNAMCAQAYIRAINAYYGTHIPELSEAQLTNILNNDRFADNDGDGRIEGISCGVAFLSLNFVYGDNATNDSDEVPRNAKVITPSAYPASCGRVETDSEGPEYFEGGYATITAIPEAPDAVFLYWEGDVPPQEYMDNPLTMVMDRDRNVTAVFDCTAEEGEGAAEGEEDCAARYLIPVAGDADGDYLSDGEESALIMNPYAADEDGNMQFDGIDLALEWVAQIEGLPHFQASGPPPYETLPPGVEETLPKNEPYVVEIDYGLDCLWVTAACGIGVTIGELRIVNPALHASWKEGFSIPLDAWFYMQNGSFGYASNIGCQPERSGRVSVVQLWITLNAFSEGEGAEEGSPEGAAEGEGVEEGAPEGSVEGSLEGQIEGSIEGMMEGDGAQEGQSEGSPEGTPEGIAEGVEEGLAEGQPEGQEEGLTEGMLEGVIEGGEEGAAEGVLEGVSEGEGVQEGQIEGAGEGNIAEGEGVLEGQPEGVGEGIAEGEGQPEGIGEGTAEGEGLPAGPHSADQNGDNVISLTELLRVIQFFNSGGLQCVTPPGASEDGYLPGLGENHSCAPHSSDYSPQNWQISLTELLRLIQFFNTGGYHACPGQGTEDGYCLN